LIKADGFNVRFNEMVASSPWPSSISEMISKGWRYPNGETFTPEAWARLAQYDKGTRSLFIICGAEGDALWAPFFAAEAERRGMPLTALEEMLDPALPPAPLAFDPALYTGQMPTNAAAYTSHLSAAFPGVDSWTDYATWTVGGAASTQHRLH
jgi:hypothetical protein